MLFMIFNIIYLYFLLLRYYYNSLYMRVIKLKRKKSFFIEKNSKNIYFSKAFLHQSYFKTSNHYFKAQIVLAS